MLFGPLQVHDLFIVDVRLGRWVAKRQYNQQHVVFLAKRGDVTLPEACVDQIAWLAVPQTFCLARHELVFALQLQQMSRAELDAFLLVVELRVSDELEAQQCAGFIVQDRRAVLAFFDVGPQTHRVHFGFLLVSFGLALDQRGLLPQQFHALEGAQQLGRAVQILL